MHFFMLLLHLKICVNSYLRNFFVRKQVLYEAPDPIILNEEIMLNLRGKAEVKRREAEGEYGEKRGDCLSAGDLYCFED